MPQMIDPQNLISILAIDNPKNAREEVPIAEFNFTQRVKDSEAAYAEIARLQGVCADNEEYHRFLNDQLEAAASTLSDLRADMRVESRATREHFAVKDLMGRCRPLADAIEFYNGEIEFLVSVTMGADDVLLHDAVAQGHLADYCRLAAEATLVHLKTVATLGPALEAQGGSLGDLGILGKKTEILRQQAELAYRKHEQALTAAHEARRAYEQRLNARVSKGILTAQHIAPAIGR